MPFADSEGLRIYYADTGEGEPALLCLPGWCNDHTIFAPLAERLSANHRVLAIDWRGHGRSQASDRDFGFAEMAVDALAVIEGSGAHSFIPIAQGQAPWVTIELQRLGGRMPKIVASSWPVISPSGNPLASQFLNAIRALQYYERWRKEGAEQLLKMWLSGAPAFVESQIRNQMLLQGYEMYALEGEPLRVLSEFDPQVPVLHVYSQPRAPEFLSVQEAFAREHPWYFVHRLEGVSQFPTLEVPDEMATVIREFIR
jgi:pimeloyl-ACP methyl ester carboxylesterase